MTRERVRDILRSAEWVVGDPARLLRAVRIDPATLRAVRQQHAEAAKLIATTFRGVDVQRLC